MVSQHALQQVSGGCLLPGGACSWGVPAPGGVEETPPACRQLLLRTVRILLECILVCSVVTGQEPNWMLNLDPVIFDVDDPAAYVDITFLSSEGPIRFQRDLLYSEAPDPGFDIC